jgi:hypothetical protein
MIRYLLSLFLLGVVTINAANPKVAGGQSVVLETNGTHYVTAPDGTTTVTAQKRASINKSLYDFGAEANGDITLVVSNIPSATPVIVPKYGSPFYMTSLTNTSKDLILHFEDGAEIIHGTNATGHMIHMVGGSITLTGKGILDGNKANQADKTNNSFALIYGCEPTIDGLTFENWMYGVLLDYQTKYLVDISNVKVFNGHQYGTNETRNGHSAFMIAPGVAGYQPFVRFDNIIATNAASSATVLPGLIYIAGSDSNGSEARVSITRIFTDRVGGDTIIGSTHYGTPVFDIYEDFQFVYIGDFYITNSQYMGPKIQNAANAIVENGFIHTTGATAVNISPGERSQAVPYWNQRLHNLTIDMTGNLTGNAVVINAGDSAGFRTVDASYIRVTNTYRGIVVEGFNDAGTVDTYGSRVTLDHLDVQTDGHSAVQVYGFQGDLKISNSRLAATNTGSGLTMVQTNANATVTLIGNTFEAQDSGWGIRVNGVAELIANGNTFESLSGEAIELQGNTEGENILNLKFDQNNIIRGGTVDAVTADITAGYFWNGSTVTHYPSGATMTIGDGTSTYLDDWRLDYAGATLGRRGRNLTDGGAWFLTWAAENATGSIGIFDNNYSDGDRADRFVVRAESDSSGLDLDSVSGTVRAKAGGVVSGTWTSTNYAQVGNITVADEAYSSAWNGVLQVPTKNAIWDAFGMATNVAGFALGDLSTTLVTGTGKAYWVAPYDGTVLGVFGSLLTASASGGVQYDINKNGTTILSTQLTVDATELSSIDAATNAVISVPNFSAGDVFTMDVDVAGSGAAGPQINIAWKRR